MKFIKPKVNEFVDVKWTISQHTKSIIESYSEYTGYSEDEVVDKFLKNLLEDEEFKKWILKKRNNKRICSKLFGDKNAEANK